MTRLRAKEDAATLRLELTAAGAWFWFRAEGPDENLVSAINRLKYQRLLARFEVLHLAPPTAEEMYAYAADKWPAHKLQAAPQGGQQ